MLRSMTKRRVRLRRAIRQHAAERSEIDKSVLCPVQFRTKAAAADTSSKSAWSGALTVVAMCRGNITDT